MVTRLLFIAALGAAIGCGAAEPRPDAPKTTVGRPPPDEPPPSTANVRIEVIDDQPLARPRAETARPLKRDNSRITLDVRDARVVDVLRMLAEHGDFDLIVDDDIQGRVTLRLANVTVDEAFEVVLSTHGLGWESRSGVVLVD